LQLFLAAAPDLIPTARRYTSRTACAAYRIDSGGHLTRAHLPYQPRGGVLLLSDTGAGNIADTHALCREILRECGIWSYGGVAADFEQSPTTDRKAFLEQLEVVLRMNRRTLFVPEAYAVNTVTSQVLVGTAISGGTLRERLETAAQQYTPGRVTLDLERLAMDFLLPSPTGQGRALTVEELNDLRAQLRPATFFSTDLCARYFTYQKGGQYHFILYDDAKTLLRKIDIGKNLGIRSGFLMLPEVEDLLPELKELGAF
jgi:hypothetical protein